MNYSKIKLTKREQKVILKATKLIIDNKRYTLCSAVQFATDWGSSAFDWKLDQKLYSFYSDRSRYGFWFPDFSQESQDARVICLLSFAEACR